MDGQTAPAYTFSQKENPVAHSEAIWAAIPYCLKYKVILSQGKRKKSQVKCIPCLAAEEMITDENN